MLRLLNGLLTTVRKLLILERIVLQKAQVILKEKADFNFGNFKFDNYAPGRYLVDSPANIDLETDIVQNLVKTK